MSGRGTYMDWLREAAWWQAIVNDDVTKVKLLVEEDKQRLHLRTFSTKGTCLSVAVINNSKNVLELLLSHGYCCSLIDDTDDRGNTPLHEAVRYVSKECFHILMGYRANCGITNDAGRTPLHLACSNVNGSSFAAILFHAHPDAKNIHCHLGLSPLAYAMCIRNTSGHKLALLLIDIGCIPVELMNGSGNTLLGMHEEAIKHLLEEKGISVIFPSLKIRSSIPDDIAVVEDVDVLNKNAKPSVSVAVSVPVSDDVPSTMGPGSDTSSVTDVTDDEQLSAATYTSDTEESASILFDMSRSIVDKDKDKIFSSHTTNGHVNRSPGNHMNMPSSSSKATQSGTAKRKIRWDPVLMDSEYIRSVLASAYTDRGIVTESYSTSPLMSFLSRSDDYSQAIASPVLMKRSEEIAEAIRTSISKRRRLL
jgi:hypothetical protein